MKKLWLGLMMFVLVVSGYTNAQTYTVPYSGSSTGTVTPGVTCNIYDHAGANNNYSNYCNGTLVLHSLSGQTINITGSYNTESCCDRINIYNGSSTSSTLLGTFKGTGNINVTSTGSYITINFYSDGSVVRSGFELTATTQCSNNPLWVQNVVSNISDSTIQISWNDATSTTSWIVKYGTDVLNLDHSITTSTPNVFITGLDYETTYFFRILNNASDSTAFCGSAIYNFTTPCGQVDGCINYTNLNSCHVTARYGTFTNPDQNIGVIDYGSESASSRHTVHTNLNEYDQNTNYGLKTVPPGFDASVRLGNWLTGSQAESITYEYTVDTIKSDLLIMKYAAVLENPNHTPNEQPRFKFQILDEDGLEIDASCYSANFISNVNLGWNSYGNYLWKDWTTVGVDLSQLHGQTIYIKLTTYDCNRSGHFGYAYFVFDCTFKSLSSSNCGNVVENTFTAPDGFSYRWYKSTAPSVTLSTQRSLHVTQAGEYHCSLHFIGAPAGSNCSFDLVAIAGERYPTALFTYEMRDTVGCMTNVQLLNNSVISHDNAHQQLTNLPCEGVIWIFDDGTTSTVNNPIHAFEAGPHTVQLVATLGNGTCTDTLSQQILVANHCAYYDTVYATICNGETYTLFDTVLTASGIYTRDSLLLNRTLYLTVLPPNTTTVDTTIVENSLPFTFGGQQFNDTVSNHTIILTDTYGCDSTIHLTLNVWRNVTVSADSTLCENMLPLHWNGRTFTTDSTVTVNLATIGLHASHGEDSILTMNIHVLRNSSSAWNDTLIQNQLPYLFNGNNYTLASFSNNGPLYASLATTVTIPNAAGCDSSIHVNLHLWRNVTASADSTICQNDAPLQWNGHSFATSGAATVTLTAAALHGVDSTLTMNVNINQNTTLI
ncbi:MAG: hypothetical protein J6X86_08480, partial [Bacteroidales bacterium]|nr:hypothetical protein [Bacteroidales bacterium]